MEKKKKKRIVNKSQGQNKTIGFYLVSNSPLLKHLLSFVGRKMQKKKKTGKIGSPTDFSAFSPW